MDKMVNNKNKTFFDLINPEELTGVNPPLLGKCGNKYYELRDEIPEGKPKIVGNEDAYANKAYIRTLQFVLIHAVLNLYKDARISLDHSISKGIFGQIHKEKALDEFDITDIKNKMQEIIDKNIVINEVSMLKSDAVKIFEDYGMIDKVKLINSIDKDKISLYELEGRYDYFYGEMAYSTGVLKSFDLIYYEPGFLLKYPQKGDINIIPKYIEQKKLFSVFYETGKWLNILEVANVGSLNEKVMNNEIGDLIRVSEALHEKKIAYIADMIHEREDVKLILIAGPSSSGKTTFANRLAIQLRVNGLIPVPIGLDDYFVNRENTPIGEDGKPDFECLEALDVKLFNDNLNSLFRGEEVEIPSFNFKTGKREWIGRKLSLPYNGVIVVEGIHGLNEELTAHIDKKYKFKIYISALTQLNIDSHNRISTTDVRKIRRIVRDYLSRGYDAEGTLAMWDSIRRGEEKNIFVHQEQADVMFNSTLVYELCVLKKYALQELSKISEESSSYAEAHRLKSFLKFFKDIDKDMVPENSLLREFIGGSCFYKY
ncbi:nucleoside kinase [Inconstantimicrobium porci]|uniref:Nucleoside kinase n=1 Tax=Inconstantimicrobium porci TaxID=2652291 RepID=A0A7X2MY87_9CLOT|nr:nucleoside kinase [Inconstantimicrobium porci]MDD6770542.1 nucleoside kinase [Inconstantimicrobium porci]MSR91255.1 nucleoside kinase [Inconstantimicrobium porci]